MPCTSILPNKIKTFNYLINAIDDEHPDLEIPKHALLIGAGCSLQCGIPSGRDLIELCKIHSYFKERVPNSKRILAGCRINIEELRLKIIELNKTEDYENFLIEKESILDSNVLNDKKYHIKRLLDFLKEIDSQDDEILWDNYEEVIKADNGYSFWMNQYSEDAETRQRFIEEVMDNREPDGAYIILSYLIEKRKFTNVLTTNFDDLINEALMYYTEQRCRFYVDDELSQYISIHNKKPNIIKLHGDYRFANMKNTAEETDKLTRNIDLKLLELLRHLGLILVGYNGADYSIMSVLQKFKESYKYPLIWCGINAKDVHWRVAHLINNTENSFFVEIKGFDWLMGQLAINFLTNVPNVEEKAREKKKVIDGFLEKFKVQFRKSGGSKKDVKQLDETIGKWARLHKASADRDYLTILTLQTEAIESGSNEPYDFLWRGYALHELERYDEAINDYNKAIDLNSIFASAYLHRGNAYNFLKDYDQAFKDYDKAIELDPKDSLAYSARGSNYHDIGQYDKAIDDYNKAIDIHPNDPDFYNNRGFSYIKIENYNKAIDDFLKAIDIDKNHENAYKHYGVVLTILGKYDEARSAIDKALILRPDYIGALEASIELYEKAGDQKNAQKQRGILKRVKEEKK